MKIKNIKRVLQITSVFGVVASTAIATTQRVYSEKDKSIFNIDNFEQYSHKVLGAPSAVGDKFNVHANEKAQWGLIGGEIECQILQEASVTGSGASANMTYGKVKVLRNTDSNNIRTMKYPTVPAFVTGDDNYTYVVSEVDDYLFAKNSGENSYTIVENGPNEHTFRLPYSLKVLGSHLIDGQLNFSCKKFAWSSDFHLLDFNAILDKKILSTKQIKEVTINNLSTFKTSLRSNNGLFDWTPREEDILTTVKTNRIESYKEGNLKSIFLSCNKIDTVLQSDHVGINVAYSAPIPLVPLADVKSIKTTTWELENTKIMYPDYVTKITTSSNLVCDDVHVEIPSDYELTYDADAGGIDMQERFNRKLYAFSDTFFLNKNQDIPLGDEIDVTFDFPDFPNLKDYFRFDPTGRENAFIHAASADGFKALQKDKKYPVNFTVTSKIDRNIKKTYSFAVTNITPVPVESVTVNPITIKEVGETQALTATVNPQDADQNVTWSIAANPSDAAVIENGNTLKFNKTGTFSVTATSTFDPTKTGTSGQIEILPKSVTNIDLSKTTMTGTIGTSDTIRATVTPADTEQTLNWKSSDDAIVRVERAYNKIDCDIYLDGVGTAIITATSAITPSVSATCTITVNQPAPTSVNVYPATLVGKIGDETTLTVTVDPDEADQRVTWSSDNEDIATVDTSGLVHMNKAGTAIITATSIIAPSISGTCAITVNKLAPTSVTVNPVSLVGKIGDENTLTATVEPAGADQGVTWSSDNEDIATVDANGHVSMKKAGTTTITATSAETPSVSGTCTITVNKPEPTSVTVNPASFVGKIGDEKPLTATVKPAGADQGVTWSSNNEDIATVDASGLVRMKKAGTAIIKATSAAMPSVSGTCSITVNKPAPTSVTVNPASLVGKIGDENTLTATVEPAVADQRVTWSSNNEGIATVDANGRVFMKKAGTCEISATSVEDTSKKGVCQVTVREDPITNFKINTNGKTSFKVNEPNVIFKIVVNPGADNAATWVSSDNTIATIDLNGRITLIQEGTVTITATSTVDSSKTDSIEIKVVKQSELPWAIIGGSIGGVVGVAAIGGTTFGIIKNKKKSKKKK